MILVLPAGSCYDLDMARGDSSSDRSANSILYGDLDPRTPTDTTGQVIVDGFTYTSAFPRFVPEGDDADSAIKRLITQWPTIASDRNAALHYLLCVLGTGHDWNEKGELVSPYEEEPGYWERHHIDRPLLEDPEEQYQFLLREEEKQRRQSEESRSMLSPEVREASDKEVDALMEKVTAAISKQVKADKVAGLLSDLDNDPKESMSDYRERQLRERASEEAELNRKTREDADQLSRLKKPLQHPYPLSEGCALLSFPDDVEDSWLEAIIETAEMIKDTPEAAYDEPGYEPEQTRRKYDTNQRQAEEALRRAKALREQRNS